MIGQALIVGGSSSIGPATIARFAAGCRGVLATYRSARPSAMPANVQLVACDFLIPGDRARLVETVAATGAGLDAVIVLAGDILGKNLEATTDADMAHLSAVNLNGPAALLRDLLACINAGARVLLVSSIAGERGSYDPLYAATKGALIPFAKSLATWHGARMTVTVVAPGPIEESKMLADMSPERVEHHRKASPIGIAADTATSSPTSCTTFHSRIGVMPMGA